MCQYKLPDRSRNDDIVNLEYHLRANSGQQGTYWLDTLDWKILSQLLREECHAEEALIRKVLISMA